MTTREVLGEIVGRLGEQDLREILEFARFLSGRAERGTWRGLALEGLERAYGEDEPDYTEADIKPGSSA